MLLTKVAAYANLSGGRIDQELVNMALADLIRQPEKVSIDIVLEAVSRHYNVSREELTGPSP